MDLHVLSACIVVRSRHSCCFQRHMEDKSTGTEPGGEGVRNSIIPLTHERIVRHLAVRCTLHVGVRVRLIVILRRKEAATPCRNRLDKAAGDNYGRAIEGHGVWSTREGECHRDHTQSGRYSAVPETHVTPEEPVQSIEGAFQPMYVLDCDTYEILGLCLAL